MCLVGIEDGGEAARSRIGRGCSGSRDAAAAERLGEDIRPSPARSTEMEGRIEGVGPLKVKDGASLSRSGRVEVVWVWVEAVQLQVGGSVCAGTY